MSEGTTAVVLFICILAGRFFSSIPEIFENLYENGVITKKSCTKRRTLGFFNDSLRGLENRINHPLMYGAAGVLSLLGFFTYNPRVSVEDPGFVGWRHFYLFEVNWILFSIVAALMFFILGIFMWKIFFTVRFIGELDRKYELKFKPHDTDGLGGFGPLEQLWFSASLWILPVILIFLVLFILDRFSKAAFFPLRGFLLFGLYVVVVVTFVIYPILRYHYTVRKPKNNLLKKIEKKIIMYYRNVERDLSRKERILDIQCRKEIKDLDEFAHKVKNIPSWPFTTVKKAGIFLGVTGVTGAISAVSPLVTKLVEYLTIYF